MKYTLIDLCIGGFSSSVNLLVGYPLDFIKTRMQVDVCKSGAVNQGLVIIKREGFLTLYRGLSAQMTALMVSGSLYFSTYESIRKQFSRHTNLPDDQYLPYSKIFIAGAIAGLLSSAVQVPFEYMKVLSQTDIVAHQGPFSQLKNIFKEHGIIQLYKGSHLQFSRDIIGCGSFFVAQNYMLKQFTPEGKSRRDASQLGILISSMAAGASYWVLPYPIDTIKTRYQVGNIKTTSVIQQLYQEGGALIFYKGFKVTVVRGMLVNLITLPVYENSRRFVYSML